MKLIPISGRELCKIVEKIGFVKVHQVGSHVRYVHQDGRKTTVPVHGNEDPEGKGLCIGFNCANKNMEMDCFNDKLLLSYLNNRAVVFPALDVKKKEMDIAVEIIRKNYR